MALERRQHGTLECYKIGMKDSIRKNTGAVVAELRGHAQLPVQGM